MERRAQRSRAEKKSSGVLQNSVSRAIVSMAQDFSRGVSRPLDVSNLLSMEGFDHGLAAAIPRIMETTSGLDWREFLPLAVSSPSRFDLPGFIRKLTDEATSMRFDGTFADGGKAQIRADLFTVVLGGWKGVMEEFVSDASNLQQITRSFRSCGLLGRGSSVVMSPVLVDADAAADIMPGRARLLTEVLQRPMAQPDFQIGDAMRTVLDIEPSLADDDAVIAHRMLMGVRIQVVRDGSTFDPDFFSAGSGLDDVHGLTLWKNEMSSLLPEGVQALPPETLSRGRSVLAMEIVIGQLLSEAHLAGVAIGDVFDEIHMGEANGEVLIWAIHEGHPLGPVRVQSTLAFSDAEWFAERITAIANATVRDQLKPILQ
jgi:hypothetical protein